MAIASMKTLPAKSMPAIFVGHGNPMNVIRRNQWTEGWKDLGKAMPRPRAILAVSAHWYLPSIRVTAMTNPRTIHDFGGFPKQLFEIKYRAPGAPSLAEKVREMLGPLTVELDHDWGLDHGTWSVLYHIFPIADIPVVQLSIDRTKPPSFHYEIGQLLAPLRDEGILIMGSGNIVHNLQAYEWDRPEIGAFEWASRFEEKIRNLLQSGKNGQLVNYPAIGHEANLAVPTPDHYLPFLYVLGTRRKEDLISFPIEGFDGGSMSMLTIQISP
jgi:4,5-DOPA dioxygenase extradiol